MGREDIWQLQEIAKAHPKRLASVHGLSVTQNAEELQNAIMAHVTVNVLLQEIWWKCLGLSQHCSQINWNVHCHHSAVMNWNQHLIMVMVQCEGLNLVRTDGNITFFKYMMDYIITTYFLYETQVLYSIYWVFWRQVQKKRSKKRRDHCGHQCTCL